MLARESLLRRLVFLTRIHAKSQSPRSFTQKTLSLTISRGASRPQLPFLHPAAVPGPSNPHIQPQNQLARFMSSESRRYYQDVFKKSMRLSAAILAILAMFEIMRFGIKKEIADRQFPAPPEWSWRRKWHFSRAAAAQIPSDDGRIVDWAKIGTIYVDLLKELEDPEQEGQNLRPILDDDGDIYVAGVGKAGLDLSEKSEPWRRGYHTCLMGAAKAAELMDGWVKDKTRRTAFPAESVIGPSNPNPKPLFGVGMEPPLEENCEPLFPGPEVLYIKLLTSKGFTSHQRLEAAVAYADWLEYKGLSSTAEEMYDWALDIAIGALPIGVNDLVDVKTGIISSKATYVSSNILSATTALAEHHARNDNIATALPIFLSVLRARRQLLSPPPRKTLQENESGVSYLSSLARSLLFFPPYPPPPPTGDEIPSQTPAAICEEAAVMLSIGEILFAASSFEQPSNFSPIPIQEAQISAFSTTSQTENFQSGLSWTRDAVDLAEETLASTGMNETDEKARMKCVQCLEAGMVNWSAMVERMLQNEQAAKKVSKDSSKLYKSLWRTSNNGNDNLNRWEGEARVLDTRSRRIKKLLALERVRDLPPWMRLLGKTRDF